MKPIVGYEKLSESERKLFIVAHNKHLAYVNPKKRSDYSLGKVLQVATNPQEQAVDVTFLNGEIKTFSAKEIKQN